MSEPVKAKLTIGPGDRAGRFIAYELTGVYPDARVTTRRIDVCVTQDIRAALQAYIEREGLTLVGRPKKVGTSLQVGVR